MIQRTPDQRSDTPGPPGMHAGDGETNSGVGARSDYRLPDRPPRASAFTVDRVIRYGLGIGALLVFGWLLWYFASLVVYLLVGGVLAYLIRPLVDRIQGFGLGRIPAILVTFVLLIVMIGVILTLLVPFVAKQASYLSEQFTTGSAVQITTVVPGTSAGRAGIQRGDVILKADGQDIREYDQLLALLRDTGTGDQVALTVRGREGTTRLIVVSPGELQEGNEGAVVAAEEQSGYLIEALGVRVRTVMFFDVITAVENQLGRLVPIQKGTLVDTVSELSEALFREERITQLMGSIVGFFTDVFYAVLVIPFVTFFVLKDGPMIRHNLLRLVPNRYFEITLAINEKVETNIGRYFRGLLIQCVSIATVATLLLQIVGLNAAVAVGIFAGLANTIPYFGPLMGFLAGTIVGIAQTGNFSLVPGVLVAMGLTQIADNVFFQPLIFSKAAQAHPLIILFVVLIGAQLGGIVGMLVAIPVATVVRVMVQQILWSLRNYRILRAS